jgi:hypothetical protein
MKNNTINNFKGFLFEKDKKDKEVKNSSKDSEKSKDSNNLIKDGDEYGIQLTDKIKLILNPILFCINQSLECIISISKNTISTDDSAINTNINGNEGLKENIKKIRGFIGGKSIVGKISEGKYSDPFTDIVDKSKTLIIDTSKLIDDSIMSENDFINIKNKAKDNKTGEKLEAAIYKTLKDSFGLYQGAIKNYMIASDEYLKIYKQKAKNQLSKELVPTTNKK